MIKKILIFITLFIFTVNNSFALEINPKIEKLYNNFYSEIEKKFDKTKQVSVLIGLNSKLKKFKNLRKYKNNSKIQNILNQFIYLNNKKVFKLKKDIILIKYENNKSDNIYYIEESNKYKREFEEEKKRRKSIIEKYDYSKFFKNISYTKNNIFLENGIWYTYSFKEFSYFPDNSNISLRDIKYNNIDINKALLFVKDDNKLGFVKNPKKVRLISNSIISSIDNKYYLLEEIKDDLRIKSDINYDKLFIELKVKSKKITGNLSTKNKIQNIYNYILRNTNYSSSIDFNNYKIFSGIETYKNNDGICEGYSKLMVYMLMFSGVTDVSVIRGYVIDAEDFPEVGHAWVKVGDHYYDPTFDDPLGATLDKKYNEYKYFNMPKDIFYTNRFNKNSLPENIKGLSIQGRKSIIQANLSNLYNKYKNSNYKLLRLIKIKKENNINYDEEITLDNFDKIIDLKIVNNFSFSDNGHKKIIKKLKYYELDGLNLENLLEQLEYNLDGKYFFLWYDKNGNSSYRLGYEVIF